jgi:hypothetical protein
MSPPSDADKKGLEARARRKAYLAFLNWRIPELMAKGHLGRQARHQADYEWARARRSS